MSTKSKKAENAALLKQGDKVVFTEFAVESEDEYPENHECLEEGMAYEIAQVNPQSNDDDLSYTVLAPNPNFDSSKRASKKANPEFVEVVLYHDECVPAKQEAEKPAATVTKKTATKKTATKKTVAKKKTSKPKPKEDEEVNDEDLVDEYDPHKDPELAKMILLEESEEDADVMAMVGEVETDEGLVELAKDQADEANLADYRLGGILYHIRVSGLHKKIDEGIYDIKRKGWEKFIQDKIGIEYRKAHYLIDIYTKFNKYGISGDVVAEIGWTKASKISAVMTGKNATKLVRIAQTSTVEELKEAIRQYKGDSEKNVVPKTTMKYRVDEDAGEALEEIFEQAEEYFDNDDHNVIFERIVVEWAQDHLSVSGVKKATSKQAAVNKKVASKKTAVRKKVASKKTAVRKKASTTRRK